MATPSHPGDRQRASTREALVTGSMPDAPTWKEPGEDTGGRSFPRKPRAQKPSRAQARPTGSPRRSAANHGCHLTQGATRRPRSAKPDKATTLNPEPKKRPAIAGHERKERTFKVPPLRGTPQAGRLYARPCQRKIAGNQPVPMSESVQRSSTSSFLSLSHPAAANGPPCASTTASIILAFGTSAR